MKRLLILAMLAAAFTACNKPVTDNDEPKPREESPLSWKESLTAAECREYEAWLKEGWVDSVARAEARVFEEKKITQGRYTMPLDWKVYGSKPADGRSLYISLHGGGGAPATVNDSQWENQKTLYKPAEGVYLCPRAIENTWDLHFRPESDAFYEEIIRMAVTWLDVNPDKVYLMGYSAGGDGVWRLAPRMADHWAASSMMAGHPGDVSLLCLRNLPFMVWCGENDTDYQRNIECAARIAELDSLQAADPEGYVHEGHIVAGKGHWMDLVDAAAVPWMAKFRRDPAPKKIVWRQGDVPKKHFYWLGVPAGNGDKGKEVRAEIEDNVVRIEKSDYKELTICLNDELVDLDRTVAVLVGGHVLFEGDLKRSPATMRQTLKERDDLSYIFPAVVKVILP